MSTILIINSHTSVNEKLDRFEGFDLTIHTLKTKFTSERKYKAIYLNSLILWMKKSVAGKTVPRLRGNLRQALS